MDWDSPHGHTVALVCGRRLGRAGRGPQYGQVAVSALGSGHACPTAVIAYCPSRQCSACPLRVPAGGGGRSVCPVHQATTGDLGEPCAEPSGPGLRSLHVTETCCQAAPWAAPVPAQGQPWGAARLGRTHTPSLPCSTSGAASFGWVQYPTGTPEAVGGVPGHAEHFHARETCLRNPGLQRYSPVSFRGPPLRWPLLKLGAGGGGGLGLEGAPP